MVHALSTHLFANHRLTTVWLDRIWSHGVPVVEIFCARQHFDYHDHGQVRELGHWFRDAELKVRSIHAPMYNDDVWGRSGPQSVVNIAEPLKGKRLQAVDEVKRAIEFAETVPFDFLVQHIGVAGDEYDERKLDSAFNSLEELSVFARQRGVEILVENIPNALSSAERLNQFMEQTHLNLGYCFDVGHAHMQGGIENEFMLMKNRIRSTHIHDNNGKEDQHLFPLASQAGSIDWGQTIDLLRSGEDRYPLLLELREVPEMARPLDVVREVFDHLENMPAPEEK